jgi:hypothetical protein
MSQVSSTVSDEVGEIFRFDVVEISTRAHVKLLNQITAISQAID